MCKIIYYGISSDAPFLPSSPFLTIPPFLKFSRKLGVVDASCDIRDEYRRRFGAGGQTMGMSELPPILGDPFLGVKKR